MTDPDTGRPEPVVLAGKVAGQLVALITSVGSVLSLVFVTVTAEQVNRVAAAVAGAVIAAGTLAALLIPLWKARQARAKVTPLSDPRAADGTRLVRLDSLPSTTVINMSPSQPLVGGRPYPPPLDDPQQQGVADHSADGPRSEAARAARRNETAGDT